MTASPRLVGRIGKPHGLLGELAVQVYTDSPEERFAVDARLCAESADGAQRMLTVMAARQHAGRLLVRFAGIADRNAAAALRGVRLFADAAELPPIEDPDEFYDHELEGLTAVTVDGTELGSVTEVVHGPGGELLAIDHAGKELLVPFVRAFVPEVDVSGGRLLITPPPGLTDL